MKRLVSKINEFFKAFKFAISMQKKESTYLMYSDTLRDLICECSGMTWEEMFKYRHTRKRKYVIPRQIHISLNYDFMDMSARQSSEMYLLDRSTYYNCKEKVVDFLDTDPEFRKKYAKVFEFVLKEKPILKSDYRFYNPRYK